MKKLLKIRLISDMCCGTGDGNGSDVDISTAVDLCGFPIIPGKRLKGILRECSLTVEAFSKFKGYTSELFGDLNDVNGLFTIEDARLVSVKVAAEIKKLQGDAVYSTLISPNQITALYTCNRSQTSIDKNGVAMDKALRTIKLVERGNCFEAEISYPDTFDEHVKMCVKLMRHIGLNKNKGLGEVQCSLEEPGLPESPKTDEINSSTVKYVIHLCSDAALDTDHIPGSVVLGAIARLCGGEDFPAKWLRHGVQISNAYIRADDKRFLPTEMSWKSEKNRSETVYNEADMTLRPVQHTAVGGYTVFESNTLKEAKVESRREYHHSRGIYGARKENEEPQRLFVFSKLMAGQEFEGTIKADRESLCALADALKSVNNIIRIGRSKSSQYGKATLILKNAAETSSVSYKNAYAAELISDAVIFDDYGVNTVDTAQLAKELCGKTPAKVFSKSGTIGGYNATWKLPKPQYQTISAGTTLVFDGDYSGPETGFIGILNNEGYGEYRIRGLDYAESGGYSYTKLKDRGLSDDITLDPAAKDILYKAIFNRAAEGARLLGISAADSADLSELSKSAAMLLYIAYRQNLDSDNLKTTLQGVIAGYHKIPKNHAQRALDSFDVDRIDLTPYRDKLFGITDEVLEKEENTLFKEYIYSFIVQVKRRLRSEKEEAANDE